MQETKEFGVQAVPVNPAPNFTDASSGHTADTFGRIRRRSLAELPPRVGRRQSALEPLARLVQALPPGEFLEVAARGYDEARRIGKNVTKLLRDRGIGCRARADIERVCIWLDPERHPKRRRDGRGAMAGKPKAAR